MRVLGLFCVLLVASPALAADGEQRLLGVWKLESWYTEFKATGEKKSFFGERPNGYLVFTPEKRVLGLLTGEQRRKPETAEDRIAAFWSMVAYSGIYRVEGDKWIMKVDVAWNESWTGTEQMRFFKVEGDKLTVTSPWEPNTNLPGSPETRGVLVSSKVKAPQ
jgi:Lipocalin-like domain